jgi:hypothetical protein
MGSVRGKLPPGRDSSLPGWLSPGPMIEDATAADRRNNYLMDGQKERAPTIAGATA